MLQHSQNKNKIFLKIYKTDLVHYYLKVKVYHICVNNSVNKINTNVIAFNGSVNHRVINY